MNLFGIGAAELAIIFLIMLIIAGPKRMMQWAFIAGTYVAKLRKMWDETSKILKKELEQAGIEPEVVDTLQELAKPRGLRKANPLDALVDEMKKPMEQALKPVEAVVDEIKAKPGTSLQQKDAEAPSTPVYTVAAPTGDASAGDSDTTGDNGASSPTNDTNPPASNTPGQYDAWIPN